MTVYVSSACVRADRIGTAVRTLAEAGYRHLELSGGTDYAEGYLEDLLQLQAEFGLSYLVHHYFPPPPEHFVLNLASLDEAIFDSSVAHCREALRVARLLGAEKYGVHAGFLIAVKVSELGRAVARRAPTDADDAVDRFTEAVRSLLSTAAGQVRLYVENNVLTRQNWERYGGFNPFLGTDADSCERLMHDTGCAPLLDLGHLRVSCRSLGRNFEADAVRMLAWTDYLHVSDNNGLADTNRRATSDSIVVQVLEGIDLSTRDVTVEVYEGLDAVRQTVNALVERGA